MHTGEVAAGAEFGDGGRYRLRSLLGTGGMASVWLAEDARLRRDVAVKILSDVLALDPDFVARFEREARLAGSLAHPHLVTVYDYGAHGTRPFLVMEYVAGGTLADRLRGPHDPRWDPAVLSRELLGALGHVHEAGIVHRDVKPANVLIGTDGRARLTDFGIAQPTEATRLTGAGAVIGTERYLAPEVRRGQAADVRSDLFSVGVLLRECLGPAPSPALHRLVAALTNDDPSDRPESAAAALALLGKAPPPPVRTQEVRTEMLPPTEVAAEPARAKTPPTAVAAPEPTLRMPELPPSPKARPRAALIGSGVGVVAVLVTVVVLLASGGGEGGDPLEVPPATATVTQQLDALDDAIDRARG